MQIFLLHISLYDSKSFKFIRAKVLDLKTQKHRMNPKLQISMFPKIIPTKRKLLLSISNSSGVNNVAVMKRVKRFSNIFRMQAVVVVILHSLGKQWPPRFRQIYTGRASCIMLGVVPKNSEVNNNKINLFH